MRLPGIILAAALVGPWTGAPAAGQTDATTTTVMFRALARDAKLIGDAVGGVRITVRDATTGATLGTGITSGGTGDTGMIMNQRRSKGAGIFATPGAAGWEARLVLTRPTIVEVTAEGPLGFPQVGAQASKTLLLFPGTDIGGDGIVLELNGLIVEIMEPDGPGSGTAVPVRARVRMLCSCPTEPGGLWSVERIAARLLDGDRVVADADLEFSGEASVYTGVVRAPGPGTYTLEVLAEDPASGNFGRAATTVTAASGHS